MYTYTIILLTDLFILQIQYKKMQFSKFVLVKILWAILHNK